MKRKCNEHSDSTQTRFLRRVAAAEYLREQYGIPCAKQTLAKYAVVGGGPVYRLAGRFPVYAMEDLDAWAQSRLSEPMRATGIAAEQPQAKE